MRLAMITEDNIDEYTSRAGRLEVPLTSMLVPRWPDIT
jgi:hypothetical protein